MGLAVAEERITTVDRVAQNRVDRFERVECVDALVFHQRNSLSVDAVPQVRAHASFTGSRHACPADPRVPATAARDRADSGPAPARRVDRQRAPSARRLGCRAEHAHIASSMARRVFQALLPTGTKYTIVKHWFERSAHVESHDRMIGAPASARTRRFFVYGELSARRLAAARSRDTRSPGRAGSADRLDPHGSAGRARSSSRACCARSADGRSCRRGRLQRLVAAGGTRIGHIAEG